MQKQRTAQRSRRPLKSDESLYELGDYARRSGGSEAGRLDPEPYRSEFRRDYARVIHSPAFRRLQGKTQLFPSHESDFFRNRLTHTLEVAQIAKSIAIRINHVDERFKNNQIDTDLVETAALAHDLGHPPFGHNGEQILDRLLIEHGGFEGNAQTLRIIARTEKRTTLTWPGNAQAPVAFIDGRDQRVGLDLTARSIAACLKYDQAIESDADRRKHTDTDRHPAKGYYSSDSDIVKWVKLSVDPHGQMDNLRLIECSIMDVADDIAYSTYDLEDVFKAGFLTPVDIFAIDDSVKHRIVSDVKKKIEKYYPDLSRTEKNFDINELNIIILKIFHEVFSIEDTIFPSKKFNIQSDEDLLAYAARISATVSKIQSQLMESGYYRSQFTSYMVGSLIRSVEVKHHPFLKACQVRMSIDKFKAVETLKGLVYKSVINSSRIRLGDQRALNILNTIFRAFTEANGSRADLLPSDWQAVYVSDGLTTTERMRAVCDFISGMTDRYCVEFYARITDKDPPSIHKSI